MDTARTVRRCALPLVLAAAIFFAAIISGAPGGAFAAARNVLTVGDWWNPQRPEMAEWWSFVESEFERLHPDVEIEFIWYNGTSEAREQLLIGYAAGVAPDVSQVSVSFARELYENGILLPLNPFIERDGSDTWDDLFPVTRIYAVKDGVIFGMPHDLANAAIVYDVHAFQQAGLAAEPFSIADWNDLQAYAERLTVRDGSGNVSRYGLAAAINSAQGFQYWIAANGGSLYNTDFTAITVNTPQAVQAVEYFLELRDGLGVVGGNIQAGTAAIHSNFGDFSALALEQARPDLTFRFTSMPPGPMGSERTTVSWSNMMAILASTDNPELAWEFVKFYTGLKTRLDMLRILKRISPLRSMYQTEEWELAVAASPFMEIFGHLAQVGVTFPFVATASAVAAVVEEVNAILEGRTSPTAGLELAASRGTAILQEMQRR